MTTATLANRSDAGVSGIRLESLDGLRGLAALFVAWFHIYQRNELVRPEGLSADIMHWTSQYGWLGVEAFFVITGFVIPYSIRAGRYPGGFTNARRFLTKRGLRLYPPFAAAAALTFAIWLAAPLVPGFRGEPYEVSATWVMQNFTLTAPAFGEAWANPVFWSLVVEVQYYLVIAILFALAPRLQRGHFEVAMAICVVACIISALAPEYLHSVVSWAPLFVIGYLLYQYVIAKREASVLLAVGAVAIGAMLWSEQFLQLIPVALTSAAILLRWNPGRILLGLGAISYSLYLIHYPIGVRAARLFARLDIPRSELFAFAASMALVILASWIFYLAFEKRSLTWSRDIRYEKA